jgi:hypothetical protein
MLHDINKISKDRFVTVCPMIYSGLLVEGDAGGEAVPSLAGDACVLDVRFIVGKDSVFGHGIAMDSAHGVFLLATAFSLR